MKRCRICRKPCPQPFKTFQNVKAMYISERVPTVVHEQCWLETEAWAERERIALTAQATAGLEAMKGN